MRKACESQRATPLVRLGGLRAAHTGRSQRQQAQAGGGASWLGDPLEVLMLQRLTFAAP